MDWTSLTPIIGILLGVEFLRFWLTRRAEKRMANTKANVEEFHALKEYNDFLQQRLIEKEQRFEEQTQLVRRLNTEVLDLTKAKADIELTLARVRCDDQTCPFRRPPTSETPPPPGIEKNEWHKQRLLLSETNQQ